MTAAPSFTCAPNRPIFVVANAGRSGSTYLAAMLRASAPDNFYIAHEDIPVQVTQPRLYNRAYDDERRADVLKDRRLAGYLNRWLEIAETKTIIETGWTVYHLLPILKHLFGQRLQVVVLHRDPWSVALSRANMGNYHPETFYDDAHEVSPLDANSIAPEYRKFWHNMNHVEKCLFWWFVCYREILEFIEHNSDVPTFQISSRELFESGESTKSLLAFFGLPTCKISEPREKNAVNRFMRETFPIRDEWEALLRHDVIARFAYEQFGYSIEYKGLQQRALRYALPGGLLPKLRHATKYWKRKASLKELLLRAPGASTIFASLNGRSN